jgi:hypothetical protein
MNANNWHIKKVCLNTCFFIVENKHLDTLKKFQVPHLKSITIVDDEIYALTKSKKIMVIDLVSDTRKFLTESEALALTYFNDV